ncbi:transcriptional regulator [Terribacillus saccharophilus]|uniref:Transcriptional regulator n=1 Tax=Terribacillus saccharophilus TaxID=361277 RepID=A0ABX4H0U8_9BACI|nr:transcriptional regulator [Terribacillus saccharophilus]PAD36350.1 transcriptional regulator [Terribacillus saccharophilus]PAD95008.1 transcriptional regulator [Terribacillus saccharophilus]PAE00725.1 transcriptional regulator [Terribacillus saccharophilus]
MYADKLKRAIFESGLSLNEISVLLKKRGFKTQKSYLSKLQNGRIPPASPNLNKALASVLALDYDDLQVAAYKEKIPKDILDRFSNTSA